MAKFDSTRAVEDQSKPEDYILQLWTFWKNTYKSSDAIREEQQRIVWTEAMPVLHELSTAVCDDPDIILKSIVTVCILLSGLGSPTAPAVIKETNPALRSVLKTTDVSKFAQMSPRERQEQVLELAQIVMGIRLFNKDCLRGGAGIDDLPDLLSRAISATLARLQLNIGSNQSRCDMLTNKITTAYEGDNPIDGSLDRLKILLCLVHMHQRYLRDLTKDLRHAEYHVNTCVNQLRDTLLQLHETVRYRAAIPTIQVYPLFAQLSVVWRELQNSAAYINHINSILQTMEIFTKPLDVVPVEGSKVNLNRKEAPIPEKIASSKLLGFCPWTLVRTSGGLVPGTYCSNGFAFVSSEAASSWSTDTVRSTNELRKLLKSRSHLRLLLDITVEEEESQIVDEAKKPPILKHDAEIQTEVHPVRQHIDKEYSWSVWELKRRALQLANLTRCATRSQQTSISYFRNNSSTQTKLGCLQRDTNLYRK